MKKQRSRLGRVICPCCGREIAAYAPSGGDGSALRIKQHKLYQTQQDCDGGGMVIDLKESKRND